MVVVLVIGQLNKRIFKGGLFFLLELSHTHIFFMIHLSSLLFYTRHPYLQL